MEDYTQVGPARDRVEVAVASGAGVVVATVGGDRVGEYGLRTREPARDVAAVEGRLAVATDDAVTLDGEPTGFGPAVALGCDGDSLVAAGPEGGVARYDGADWAPLGRLDAKVRAVDGGLLAAADGVHRVAPDLPHAGLEDVRDVDGAGLAATVDGLWRRTDAGWSCERDGPHDAVVVASGADRAHAAAADALLERTADGWVTCDPPVCGDLADVAEGPAAYAATTDGTFLVDDGDGWRDRPLGVPEVRRLAVL